MDNEKDLYDLYLSAYAGRPTKSTDFSTEELVVLALVEKEKRQEDSGVKLMLCPKSKLMTTIKTMIEG